jgi:hypothetical protein
MKKIATVAAMCVLILSPFVMAQSAGDRAAIAEMQNDAASAKAEAEAAKFKGMTDAALQQSETQERNVASQIAVMLSTATRNLDPFGLSIYGDFLALQNEQKSAADNAVQPQKDAIPPFVQAVQALKIVGLNLDAKAFFVGSRVISEGDAVTLSFKGQRFTLIVESVGVNIVVFRDSQTNQKAVARPRIVPSMAPPELQPMN